MRIATVFLLFFMLFCNCQTIALAQSGSTTGTILAVVKDPQDRVVVGANITIKQQETNLVRNIETDQEGVFQFIQLPPGNYELSINADGYSQIKKQVNITIGVALLTEIKLAIASADSDIVEVKADSPINEIKIESSNTNGSSRIDNLPINRRDFLDFALTSPRVTPDRVPNQGVLATSGLSFNGQSGRFNNITIDGLDNNDSTQGAVRSTFSQEAVQEFQVVSDSYSAEFGRALSGIVNIVTKAGGNDFHGNLFFLNRNDEISARNTFEAVKTPYSQYQFGSTLSGPIKKDKAFFFSSFERLSIKQNNIVTLSDQTVQAGRNQNYLLNNGPQPFSIGATSVLARSDVNLSTNDTFWVRYNGNFSYNGAYEPFGGLTERTNSGVLNIRDNSFAFNNTYISNSLGLVNETRFLYSRRNQKTLPVSSDAGVQLLAPEGTVTFGHDNFLPETNIQRIYQLVDNISLTRGINQIKLGVDFTYINRPPQNNGGLFVDGFGVFSNLDFSALFGMPGLPTFSGLQAFDPKLRTPQQLAFLTFISPALGFPSSVNLANLPIPLIYLQGFGTANVSVKEKLFSTFLQDDIRLGQQVLIKAGLRYDINRVDLTPNNNGNFSPRLGISYRPKKLPHINLHAAYGLFFGLPFVRSTLSSSTSTNDVKLLFITFPISVVPFSLPGHKFAGLNQLPTGVTFIPQLNLTTQYQPDLRTSYSQQISAGFDYLLGSNTTVSVVYNYVRGIKLLGLRDINPVVRPIPSNPLQAMITGRVDPTRGDVLEFESAFDSYYHGITFAVNRRLAKRINFFAHYTFSKAIDNLIDFSASITDRQNDPLNPNAERGLSLQDVRNRFLLSGTWELSYTKNRFLRDFQLSTILNLSSGRPYNLLAGVDLNQNGDGGVSDRPTGLGRDVGITPGFANLDLRLTRKVIFRESFQFQGFIEAFNLFNRVNIDSNAIDRTFPPDAQGNFNLPAKENGRYIVPRDRYRGAFAPRQFQFGFRLAF